MPLMGGGVASSNPGGAAAAASMATASALSHRVAATLDYINDTLAFKIRSAEPAPRPPPATLVQVCRPIIPCTSAISNQVCGKHLSTK